MTPALKIPQQCGFCVRSVWKWNVFRWLSDSSDQMVLKHQARDELQWIIQPILAHYSITKKKQKRRVQLITWSWSSVQTFWARTSSGTGPCQIPALDGILHCANLDLNLWVSASVIWPGRLFHTLAMQPWPDLSVEEFFFLHRSICVNISMACTVMG